MTAKTAQDAPYPPEVRDRTRNRRRSHDAEGGVRDRGWSYSREVRPHYQSRCCWRPLPRSHGRRLPVSPVYGQPRHLRPSLASTPFARRHDKHTLYTVIEQLRTVLSCDTSMDDA